MRRPRGRFPEKRVDNEPRINHRIRKSPVRLIAEDGEQLGVVPLEEAKERAQSLSLDLVEVGPTADPPVVKILDWGKAKFERDKKARESKKKTQVIEVKEVKYRPTIDPHDFAIKTKRAEGFLKKGKKVKVTIFFRYRQLRRPELGVNILDRVTQELSHMADVESRSGLDGRQMTMILTAKPQVAQKKAAKAAKVVSDAKASKSAPDAKPTEAATKAQTATKAQAEPKTKAEPKNKAEPKTKAAPAAEAQRAASSV